MVRGVNERIKEVGISSLFSDDLCMNYVAEYRLPWVYDVRSTAPH